MFKGETVSIDLSWNNFTWISTKTFAGIKTTLLRNISSLYLKNNGIKCIDRFSFRRLPRLCVLDLSFCNLEIHTPRKWAFSYLGELKILYIHGNEFYRHVSNYSYPENELSRLSSLTDLHIDVFEGFRFGSKFKRLKHLTKLKFYPTSSIFYLDNNTFNGLSESPIYNQTMNFKDHVRCDVSEDILCSFPFLTRTTMSFGGLCDLNAVLKTLKCLQNRNIEEIIAVSNIPHFVRQVFKLDENNCKYLLNVCVKSIDLGANRIAGISVNLLKSTFGRCIEHLDISQNHIRYMEPSFVVDFLQNYPKLQYLNFNHNNVDIRDIISVAFLDHSIWKTNITFTLSKVLKVILYSYNYIHRVPDFYQVQLTVVGEALKEFDLYGTSFPCSRIRQMDFPLLEVLNISNNDCTNISSEIFKPLTQLKILRASKMNSNFIAESSRGAIFDGLKNLELLDLQNNFIHHFPTTLFKEQTKLNFLYLNYNFLSSIPNAVSHFRNLKELYIRSNKIKSLETSDFRVLRNLKRVKNFIKGNILDCDCSHISMLRWMKNNQNLFADLNETNSIKKSSNFSELLQVRQFAIFEKRCQTGVWLITSSLMLFFVTIGLVVRIAIKRYRVHVDYIILRLRNRWKGVVRFEESNTFQFDAFISNSEDDYQLVCTTMYQTLTNLGFQISIPDKDFIPGVNEAEQLVQGIDHSRKVVFVITENFLDSGWNSYAVQMAVTHAFHNRRKRSIIVIIKDNIPIERMPKDLRYIWWCIFSIRWPDVQQVQDLDSFWKDVAVALRSP
ncbi:toll-like receptor 4 [Ostrea edulis]|uniref:toll-like receptor 4 n=1 Tax=Ostrea edulis TaxID=37623 RepID=UPI0024AEF3FE|nr:toll-like receptor 4 [Ostrea edulis]